MITAVLWKHLHRIHVPAALLSLLLQRTPALRVAASAQTSLINPASALLRSMVGAVMMGGYHALAGATVLTSSPKSPASATVGQSFTLAFAVTGAPLQAGSYEIRGVIPPGLTIPGLSGDLLNATSGALTGTPTSPGSYSLLIRAFELRNKGGMGGNPTFSLIINVQAAPISAPTFSAQPTSATVLAGGSVTFSATATGGGTLTYQWTKDSVAVPGATSSSLTLQTVSAASAGVYRVTASNSGGSTQSAPATLTVESLPAPAIVAGPTSQTVAAGGAVAFSVRASGTGLSYQWSREGQAIGGANDSLLVVKSVSLVDAGVYTVLVSNAGGSVTSGGATLAVAGAGNQGRLSNLSLRSLAGTGAQTLIAGFTVHGGSASNLVIRGIGPALSVFGVPGVVVDPRLELYNSGAAMIGFNDDWSGADGSLVGGFGLPVGSKDSVLSASLGAGGYTAQVKGVGLTTGEALAELYEVPQVNPGSELINLSARTQLGSGQTLVTGFSISAGASRTFLVRAIGPGLAPFGLTDFLPNPKIELFNSAAAKIAESDDWGGERTMIDTMLSVGAFSVTDGTSSDAMLVVTLPSGGYTAQITGVGGTSGVVLVEVYVLP